MRKIGIALEEAETLRLPVTDSTVDGEYLNLISDISSYGTELDGDNTTLVTAAVDTELLAQVRDTLEQESSKGIGISSGAAEIANLVTESLRERLGISGASLPSLESFETNSVLSTNLTLLSIGSTLTNAWEKIKAFFKTLIDKIKEFYNKVFSATGRLKERAIALRTKASELRGTAEEDTFENSKFARAYQDENGKFVLENVHKYTKDISSDMSTFSRDAVKLTKLVDDPHKFEGKTPTAETINKDHTLIDALSDSIFKYAVTGKDLDKIHAPNKGVVKSTNTYIEHTRLVAEANSDADTELGTKKASKLKNVKVRIVELKPSPDDVDDEDNDVPVLSKDTMIQLCKEIEDLAKTTEMMRIVGRELDNIRGKINTFATDFNASAKKVVDKNKQMSSDDKDVAKEALDIYRQVVLQVGAALNSIGVKLPAYGIKTGNTGLNYVEHSMSYYRDESK
jgi:hypothetical protein